MGLRDELRALVSPIRHGDRFRAGTGALLVLLIFGEIEGLVFTALAVAARSDLFLTLQPALAPAALLVAVAGASVISWRWWSWQRRRLRRYTEDISADAAIASARIKARRPQR